MIVERSSKLWVYLDEHLKGLISDGEALLDDVKLHEKNITDYSYLVFPFAKAYEGFLKRLFLDLNLISKEEFFSDEIRIGKILNPSFKHESKSVYGKVKSISQVESRDVSEHLWTVWRNGRNLVFHYYPHNFRKLSYREAENLVTDILETMGESVKVV